MWIGGLVWNLLWGIRALGIDWGLNLLGLRPSVHGLGRGIFDFGDEGFACTNFSLLQQPGPKKFKLSKKKLMYKARKFKVPPGEL